MDDIQEIIVLYPRKRGAKTDPQHTVLAKTSELQPSLLSILGIEPEDIVLLGEREHPYNSMFYNLLPDDFSITRKVELGAFA